MSFCWKIPFMNMMQQTINTCTVEWFNDTFSWWFQEGIVSLFWMHSLHMVKFRLVSQSVRCESGMLCRNLKYITMWRAIFRQEYCSWFVFLTNFPCSTLHQMENFSQFFQYFVGIYIFCYSCLNISILIKNSQKNMEEAGTGMLIWYQSFWCPAVSRLKCFSSFNF